MKRFRCSGSAAADMQEEGTRWTHLASTHRDKLEPLEETHEKRRGKAKPVTHEYMNLLMFKPLKIQKRRLQNYFLLHFWFI